MLAVVGDLKAVFTSWHESAAMRITSKGQITIPQEIREQCGLLPHTRVRFVVEGGRVLIEKEPAAGSPGSEGLQRLRRARLRTRLSTDELLALSRGDEQP
jgi:AbrB family looped-hinge helix DNA binding protein